MMKQHLKVSEIEFTQKIHLTAIENAPALKPLQGFPFQPLTA